MNSRGENDPLESDAFQDLLGRVSQGSAEANAELARLLGDELHGLARKLLAERPPGHTLQPTALLNEVWLKLGAYADFESRSHYLAVASKAMRSILVDHTRRKEAAKRGGRMERLPLDAVAEAVEEPDLNLLALDQALEELAEVSPRAVQVVELHFFGGRDFSEIATMLETSESTVFRQWRSARAWLHEAIEG